MIRVVSSGCKYRLDYGGVDVPKCKDCGSIHTYVWVPPKKKKKAAKKKKKAPKKKKKAAKKKKKAAKKKKAPKKKKKAAKKNRESKGFTGDIKNRKILARERERNRKLSVAAPPGLPPPPLQIR